MTREDLQKLSAMSDNDLSNLTVVEEAALHAHVRQANEADGRVETEKAAHVETARLLEIVGGRQLALDVEYARKVREARQERDRTVKRLAEQDALIAEHDSLTRPE